MPAPEILCFGECMLELSRTQKGDRNWRMGVAGDSYNVAVYLKRLGRDAAYMTALGKDEFSADIKAAWAAENLGPQWCLTHPDRSPGLYAIRLDDRGERSFTYWRNESAARAFFECDGIDGLLQAAGWCSIIYLSGITLSLFDDAGRARIAGLARAVRANGGKVAFDSNYRARGWPDKAAAISAIEDFAGHIDIALPTFEDDRALFGDDDPEACAARWHDAGATTVVVKLGEKGALLSTPDGRTYIPALSAIPVRDTTGAGDSFNAAYLAARQAGLTAEQACAAGCRLAATVIQHPGAIIPPSAMPALDLSRKAGWAIAG